MSGSFFKSFSGAKHNKNEEQAEFNFISTDAGIRFQSRLRNNTYNSFRENYHTIKEADENQWEDRLKWKVGITHKNKIHWGVYIMRAAEPLSRRTKKESHNPPVGIYKVYGTNWTGDSTEAIHLQAVWESDGKLKRDLRKHELNFVSDNDAREEPLYKEQVMYFSWPEFVLAAQFVCQEYILKLSNVRRAGLKPHVRSMALRSLNTGKAYSLLQNNCRHFSKGLIELMKANQWEDPTRLYRPFILRDLVEEWSTPTNSWVLPEDHFLERLCFWRPKENVNTTQKLQVQEFLYRKRCYLKKSDTKYLKPMNPAASIAYSKGPIAWWLSERERMRLAHVLDHVPLAISIALAYIDLTMQPMRDYLRLLRNVDAQFIANEISPDIGIGEDHQHVEDRVLKAIARTWFVTFEYLLSRRDPAFFLLLFISYIGSDSIPTGLLPQFPSWEDNVRLRKLRFVICLEDGRLGMHPLIHRMTQAGVERARLRRPTAELAISHIMRIARTKLGQDPRGRQNWKYFKRHLKIALTNWARIDQRHIKQTYELELLMGQHYLRDGDTKNAIGHFETAISGEWEDELKQLNSHLHLAFAYNLTGQYDRTTRMLRDFEWLQKIAEIDHCDPRPRVLLLVKIGLELAEAYTQQQQHKEAVAILETLDDVQPGDGGHSDASGWTRVKCRIRATLVDALEENNEAWKAERFLFEREYPLHRIKRGQLARNILLYYENTGECSKAAALRDKLDYVCAL